LVGEINVLIHIGYLNKMFNAVDNVTGDGHGQDKYCRHDGNRPYSGCMLRMEGVCYIWVREVYTVILCYYSDESTLSASRTLFSHPSLQS